jgi:hypothetical protein
MIERDKELRKRLSFCVENVTERSQSSAGFLETFANFQSFVIESWVVGFLQLHKVAESKSRPLHADRGDSVLLFGLMELMIGLEREFESTFPSITGLWSHRPDKDALEENAEETVLSSGQVVVSQYQSSCAQLMDEAPGVWEHAGVQEVHDG